MHEERGFRGHPQWDWRRHEAGNLPFVAAEGRPLDAIKRQALTVLRSYAYGGETALGVSDLDGPLWALGDVSHGSEAVLSACEWFRVAASYDDEIVRRSCCIKAYGWIERALRVFL